MEDELKQRVHKAIEASREENRGWHSDVGPHGYIAPFLRSLGLDDVADAVKWDEQHGWQLDRP